MLKFWCRKKERRQLFRVLKIKAQEFGVDLIPVSMRDISVHEGVRLKCLVPQCEFYGTCRVCPPNLPSISEIRDALKYFSQGYLVVFKHAAVTQAEINGVEMSLMKAVEELEKITWSKGYYRAMGLVVGGCKLCERCTPLNEPCRHPYRARPSPEGLGIDLTLLARKKNIPLKWPPEAEMIFLGLLLL